MLGWQPAERLPSHTAARSVRISLVPPATQTAGVIFSRRTRTRGRSALPSWRQLPAPWLLSRDTFRDVAESGFTTRPFLPIRRAYLDVLDAGRRRRMIHGLVEVDVTDVRPAVKAAGLSFTAYLAWCVARAVAADPVVQAYRQGRRLVLFDDVDVNTQLEQDHAGQKIVQSLVLRAANRKSAADLTTELRAAQHDPGVGRDRHRGAAAFASLPGFVRALPWRVVMANPFWFRRFGGTVGLSSVGMFGRGGWAIPIAPCTLMVAVGGTSRKPRFVSGDLVERELLALTLGFDHTVVDGAPAARFASRLAELVEAGPQPT